MAIEVELVNLRVRLLGERPEFDLPEWQPTSESLPDTTSVFGIDELVLVYARNALNQDQRLDGPALITETTATTWISPGWQARVDHWGNLVLEVTPSSAA
jgi:N-methylhydantoinase A/oxoprolinase/acetone carboxylase beta subunit